MPIPQELKRNLPQLAQEVADTRLMLYICVFVYGLLVYGFGRLPDAWVRIVAPSVGPLVTAMFFTLRPWNPYAGLFETPPDVVASDAAAQRLLSLLRSAEARKVVWVTAIVTSIVFLSLTSLGWVLTTVPMSWDTSVFGILMGIFVWAGVSSAVFYNRLLNWAFRSWDKQI